MNLGKRNDTKLDADIVKKVKAELLELDNELVEVDGNKLKASQCYHFDVQPMHLLFNTNCPDMVKLKVEAILARYFPSHENSSSK